MVKRTGNGVPSNGGRQMREAASVTGYKDTKMLMRYTNLRAEDLVEVTGKPAVAMETRRISSTFFTASNSVSFTIRSSSMSRLKRWVFVLITISIVQHSIGHCRVAKHN